MEEASSLELFLAKKGDSWLLENDLASHILDDHPDVQKMICEYKMMPMWTIQEVLNEFKMTGEHAPSSKQIHVLVQLPDQVRVSALLQRMRPGNRQDVFWCGSLGAVGRGEGVNLDDPRTLSRSTLTTEIARRLEETHFLLVKSPPMTGKTSLATLVRQLMVNGHTTERKKMVLFNFSTFQSFENEDFVEIFKRQCGMDWKDALSTLPQAGYVVYLVLDEAQGIYSNGKSSPRRKSSVFWEVVKAVLNNAAYSVRILMFAAYGFGVQYVQWSTPVQLDARFELGIDHLKFSRAEVFEYITKWFDGVMCFEGSQSALEEFCSRLEALTGGHVGLCSTAIFALNEVLSSRKISGSGFPSPVEWIHMLQRGSLYRDSDSALFNRLIATRAVKVLETLDLSELDRLDRIAYGAQPNSDAAIVEHCIRKGILTQTGQRVEFSSPVMWRYFVKMRVGHIERALHDPHTLPDMIAGVMRSIDYDSIRQTLVRSLSINIPLESAWQMEFYKATYRCTRTIETSVDVGALFGSIGFIDFTVRQGDNFWGIELLREGSNLVEHNFPLTLTDFCLIDFRRVDSIDNVEMESIAADMHRCEKLFVMCYDARVADVVVFNSAMDIVYRKV